MKINSIDTDVITGVYSGEQWDVDRYNIEGRTPMSTQEFSVTVDHVNKQISGDCVRYGEMGPLDPEELKEWMQTIEEAGKVLRPYEGYTFK